MLSDKGFDLWADGYDASVDFSDEDNTYPFAGYKRVLSRIYEIIHEGPGTRVLDIGFGTAVLTSRLYMDGYSITGIDFSDGLPYELSKNRYDAIICTYAIHHLTDAQKIVFLRELLEHLSPGGKILIGDVSFATRAELDECRKNSGSEWDDDEIYFVSEEICKAFPLAKFEKLSHCAGVLLIQNN